jgi:hypothetical protein
MPNAGASTYDLNVARFDTSGIAAIVLMRNDPLTDVGNDLDVLMSVERKPRARRDLIVVPHDQSAERPMIGNSMAGERDMVLGFQPAKVASSQFRP